MRPAPKLLLPAEYINDVTKLIRLAKKRVCLLSMIISDDSATEELINELTKAAKRGIEVEFAADIFTYGELGGFLPKLFHRSSKNKKTVTKFSKRLKQSGIDFKWLGRSQTTMINGRTHVKWCIVDDIVYSFGGVNLYKKGIENIDFMLKIEDKDLANNLINEYDRLTRADNRGQTYSSHTFDFDGYGDSILVDGGFIGDSIIYRRACKLAKKASDIVLVSQYCPTGKLSKILKQKNTKLYFNLPENAFSFNRIIIKFGMLFSGNKTLYTKKHYIHAKFILFTMPDGHKIAITGSHNFINAGVLLGTREMAMQTEDPVIINQLEDFLEKYIV